MLPLYLASKEIGRNKPRFAAIVLIVALVTMLVLFLAAMGDGLALGAKQYIAAIDAELIVFQRDADLSIPASRLDHAALRRIARIDGVAAVGPIGFSAAKLLLDGPHGREALDVSLIGVEPGRPGAPAVIAGTPLAYRHANEVVLDQHVLDQASIPLGSTITIKVVQAGDEEYYDLTVVGFTSGQKYNYAPSIFVPLPTWDRVRPQDEPGSGREILYNLAAIKLADPEAARVVALTIEHYLPKVTVTDPVTTYESIQGFDAMQSTTVAQQNFMLLIVALIVGGFYQIQTLQKTPQIGMLRAIGGSNRLVAMTLLVQVTLTGLLGLLIGGAVVWLLARFIPPAVPLLFEPRKLLTVALTLLAVGPLAALVALRTALKVEPLTALGLA